MPNSPGTQRTLFPDEDIAVTPPADFPLWIHDLTVAYHRKPVLWDIDLAMPERRRLTAKIARENLPRTLYEMDEAAADGPEGRPEPGPHPFDALLADRSWSRRRLRRTLGRLLSEGAAQLQPVDRFRLTEAGSRTAAEVVRKHRLWEAYLIAHADVAAAQVDMGADKIEHVLDREMIRELEALLPRYAGTGVPDSPHRLESA